MGPKLHRIAALTVAFALIAAAAPGLSCLATAPASDHGCCPPEPGFAASPTACCDDKTEASALTASGIPAPTAHTIFCGRAAQAPSELVSALATSAPPSLPTPILRI